MKDNKTESADKKKENERRLDLKRLGEIKARQHQALLRRLRDA